MVYHVEMSDNTEEKFEEDDDEEYEPDYDGHPSWYEPRQCWCNMYFMPSHEEAYNCDSCEKKDRKQIQEMLDGTIHD